MFTALASLPHLARVEVQEAEPQDVLLCAISPLARRLERFDASNLGAWSLVATPAAEVTVEATLVSEARCAALAEAIRAAEGFGTRALRIHSRRRFSPEAEALLAKASAGYARVEWNPGPAPSR